VKSVWPSIQAWSDRWFRDRQFIIRQDGKVKAFSLTARRQMLLAGVASFAAVWFVATTGAYFYHTVKIASKNAEVERTRIAYHELIEEVSSQHDKSLGITRDLDYYRAYLLTMIEQNDLLRNDLNSIANRLEDTEDDRERYVAAEQALRGQLRDMERELANLSERNDMLQTDVGSMKTRVIATEEDKRRFAAARAAIERNIQRLENELSGSQNRVIELERTVSQKQEIVDQAQAQRRTAVAERDDAVAKADVASKKLADVEKVHQLALAKIEERTSKTLAQVEQIVAATGLDPKQFVPAVTPVAPSKNAPARGGPFVPLREDMKGLPLDTQKRADTLGNVVQRLDSLAPFLGSLPLSTPVRGFAVTGDFGPRRDPFNGRSAMHEGIDLQSAKGTPIRVTAAGRVVFAGWHSAFGRLVEIDHGFGIRTRYAHMDSIKVREGERVERLDNIGTMGQSGRASGVHLHYEVLVRGRALDPARFLKASGNVLKRQ